MQAHSNTTKPRTYGQACAACKHQRRKCTPDCLFASYFPPNLHKSFMDAHSLFGLANIQKTVNDLQPWARHDAMLSIIYQSDIRAIDPVHGCLGVVRIFYRKLLQAKAELDVVNSQLAFCKSAKSQAPEVPPPKDDILQNNNYESKLVDDLNSFSNTVDKDNDYDVIVIDDDDDTVEEECIDAADSFDSDDFSSMANDDDDNTIEEECIDAAVDSNGFSSILTEDAVDDTVEANTASCIDDSFFVFSDDFLNDFYK